MVAVIHYLANKPQGANWICLIVALVLFALATLEGRIWLAMERKPVFSFLPVGLFFLALAFVV
jgi:hypothetical protein